MCILSSLHALRAIFSKLFHEQISEAEIHFEGCEFRFYCKPYFLHLHLPGELSADGHEKSSYDVDTGMLWYGTMDMCFQMMLPWLQKTPLPVGTLSVQLPKREHGQIFTNLGMLTTLLPRKLKDVQRAGVQPLIEVVGDGDGAAEVARTQGDEKFDWRMEQTVPPPDVCNS